MTPEEYRLRGITKSKSSFVNIEKPKIEEFLNLEDFLKFYIEDRGDDSKLIEFCTTETERALAYAVILLNSRVRKKNNFSEVYELMLQINPKSVGDFKSLKLRLDVHHSKGGKY